jgi:hypothetical protein
MSSWGNNDNAANAPYWAVNSTIVNAADVKAVAAAPTAANVALLYGNTTPDVYTTGETIGLFLIDATEEHSGGDKVTDVSLIQGGAGYVEAPGVTFSNGGGSGAAASATISGGAVTKVTMTNVGTSYETVPTVTLQTPVLTVPTANVNTGTSVITYTAHGQANGAALVFNWNGSANIGGLTNANTYYVAPVNANSFKLATSAANAANNVTISLTTTGGTGQYFIISSGTRATAIAVKGLGQNDDANSTFTHASHVGWNLKTVGSGGRAGRVTYETLVALANPIGDGSDDITLPD